MTHDKLLLATLTSAFLITVSMVTPSPCAEPIDIGNRLELFVDNHLIGKIQGDIHQELMSHFLFLRVFLSINQQ